MLLFAPDFGSVNSFDSSWAKLDADLWVVSWQGWTCWDQMIEQVTRKVLSLADGVSTVWYGHSMGAIVAYEVLKRFDARYRSPGPQERGEAVIVITSTCLQHYLKPTCSLKIFTVQKHTLHWSMSADTKGQHHNHSILCQCNLFGFSF